LCGVARGRIWKRRGICICFLFNLGTTFPGVKSIYIWDRWCYNPSPWKVLKNRFKTEGEFNKAARKLEMRTKIKCKGNPDFFMAWWLSFWNLLEVKKSHHLPEHLPRKIAQEDQCNCIFELNFSKAKTENHMNTTHAQICTNRYKQWKGFLKLNRTKTNGWTGSHLPSIHSTGAQRAWVHTPGSTQKLISIHLWKSKALHF